MQIQTPKLSDSRIHHYLNLARQACYYSDNKRTRVGCIMVYKSRVISIGYNLDKTNPLQKQYNNLRGFDPNQSMVKNTVHAECYSLLQTRNLDIDWRKVHVFVYRIKKDDTPGLARPCAACEGMLRAKGIAHVYYSTEGGYCYEKYE